MAEEMAEKGIKSMKIFLILLVINFILLLLLLLLLFLFCACKVASMADRHIDNDIVENNK